MDDCCDVTATTTFEDEGLTIVKDLRTNTYKDDSLGIEMQSICDYLAKPVLLYSSNWTSSDVAGVNLFSTNVGSWIDAPAPGGTALAPMWYDKVKGYNLFRGTFVVRVVINSMPFQAGALLGRFLPMVKAMNEVGSTSYAFMHNYRQALTTQQPNFILKADMSSAVIEIPFISPTAWYPIPTTVGGVTPQKYGWGTFYLDVLAPLKTGVTQSGEIPYTIYGYWRDVELAAPLVPHMRSMGKSSNVKTLPRKKGIVSVVSKESEDTTGPIGSVLSKVSVASGMLSAIPLIGTVMGNVSWASGLMAGAANVFGWSKPISSNSPEIMSTQFSRYLGTSDGVSTSYPTALRSDNQVEITDRFTPRAEDEMSFGFLKSVSALLSTQTWTTANGTGVSIYQKGICPNAMCVEQNITPAGAPKTLTVSMGPPIFYLSRGFRRWRGSFKIKMVILKTQFHTGRLQVTYTPSSLGPANPGVNDSSYSLREIIDIRQTTEIEFTIPYLSEYSFLEMTESMGTFTVVVLNELRAPDTVASEVDIMFFFSGGEDLQYCIPMYAGPTKSRQMQAFTPQMLQEPTEEKEHLTTDIIGNVSTSNALVNVLSVGEEFTSVRQLTARLSPLSQSAVTFTGGAVVNPWFIDVNTVDITGIIGPGTGGDAFSYIAKMYAFMRGGMEIHALPSLSATEVDGPFIGTLRDGSVGTWTDMITSSVAAVNYWTAAPTTGTAPLSSFGGWVPAQKSQNMVSFSVPYYCATPVSLVVSSKTNSWSYSKAQPFAFLNFSPGFVITPNIRFGRTTRDDFQFSYFVGCPPVYTDLL